MTEREIFLEALEIATPDARTAFLNGACGRDTTLRGQVDELLKEHFANDSLLAAPALAESPARMIGRYKLLEQIGEGGFGEVWMAEQREPVKRRVALKLIKLGMDSRQIVARFEAERQALAMMDHPNIAKIFDAGTTGIPDPQRISRPSPLDPSVGRPYFVMELVRGIRITDYCDQNQLSTRDRLDLFILVCQAIQHAHQKGIIHRDIKPSNILVTLHDGVPVPKVIDFGIAKATQQELTDKTVFTQFQQFIGTPAYISPEQAEMSGLDIDTRADIYSLGVLLYELLVGQTPFDAQEMMQGGLDALRQIIREREPLRPSTKLNTLAGDARTTAAKRRQTEVGSLVHQLQGDLDWIVMKCLEKDRVRRYETATGLAADVQRYLTNEPVVARPPSAGYRFKKAYQRNELVFTAGAIVVVALVAGTGASTWQAVRATRAKGLALQAQTQAQLFQQKAEAEQLRAGAQARKASESREHSRRLLYAADMSLAQQSLKANNLGKVRRLLDRHRPQFGEEDLRGWEWRYLWQLTRSSALVTLTNCPVRGSSVSFSPDGTRLAVGWMDGRVDLWDVPGRMLIRTLTDREHPHAGHVAFAPAHDLLVATSEPNVVRLYDLNSGRESIFWRAPDPGNWDVRDIAFSEDGSKLVIYAAGSNSEFGHAVWVVNVSSAQIESRHSTPGGVSPFSGSARLSPDKRRLYLTRSWQYRSRIQCLDLATGQELWQTEPAIQDEGITKLAISPDGRLLASGSAFQDPAIRVWDSATGQLMARLDGHTSYVSRLTFSNDGRRLISAGADQSIRFWDWDKDKWTPTKVLRGHVDEIHALAISESTELIASASRDGDLMLWRDDAMIATDGYSRLPDNLRGHQILPLDHSRVLLLPPGNPPELVDFKRDSFPVPLPHFGSSTNVLGSFSPNVLCRWDGTHQIVVDELHGTNFIQQGAIPLQSGARPMGFTYNPTRRLMAWTEGISSSVVYLASLAAPGRRIELKSDVPGLVPFLFSEDGNYLAAGTMEWERRDTLRVWNVETGQFAVSINERWYDLTFAQGGRVFVVSLAPADNSEIRFYDFTRPEQPARLARGRFLAPALAVSPDGGLVAAATWGGPVRLFDAANAESMGDLDGHMNASQGVAFSPDGRRLISTFGGAENVKLWDVGTRQELLNLAGIGDSQPGGARWTADGDVILADAPWQAWRAPSWEEIAAAEAKEKSDTKRP